MKQNVGSIDRIVRAVAGLLLLVLALTGVMSGVMFWIGVVLGVVLLATAAVSFCPLYLPLRINTKKS